jgi:nucleoside phosphorylase
VAWEGAGVARVCAFNGLGFVEVRGVTDGADAGAPGDFRRHLDVAVANVGALIGTWLSRTAAAGREPS